jgi:ribosome biogenesis GTPase
MNLTHLGWSKAWADLVGPDVSTDWVPARVVSEYRGARMVVMESGERMVSVAGRLEHEATSAADLPHIGDWVLVSVTTGSGTGVIQRVLPRRTRLARKIPGRAAAVQILAANIDTAFIVLALDSRFHLRRLERFLAVVLEGGVRPVIILNKADLCPDSQARVDEVRAAVGGAEVLLTSATRRKGLRPLGDQIREGQTVAFIGSSGVGKSSLVNRLCGDLYQATIQVREKDDKGRHTTTSRELIPLPSGGFVIDTPGLRELQVWADEEGTEESFPEILIAAEGCRFRDCRHIAEPGCAVVAGVASGAIPKDRHERFLKLSREASELGQRVSRQRPVGRTKKNPRAFLEDPDADTSGDEME